MLFGSRRKIARSMVGLGVALSVLHDPKRLPVAAAHDLLLASAAAGPGRRSAGGVVQRLQLQYAIAAGRSCRIA